MGRRRRRRRKRRLLGCLWTVAGAAGITLAAAGVFLALLGGPHGQGSLTGAEDIPYQEVRIEADALAGKFYYGQLSKGEQEAYQEILQGVQDNAGEIYVHSEDANRTNELFVLVLKDFPEIFWCDGRARTTSYQGEEAYTVLKPQYVYDGQQKKEKQEQIEAAVLECLEAAPVDGGDYEKILYVYEYIVDQVEYDEKAEDNQNICSVFVNRRSVCAGYSKATQYLLERLGVFCTYVTGTTQGNESHAWNLVSCEGDYYYVDTTWGDPVFQSAGDKEDRESISYDYLCCSDEELFRTHTPDEGAGLPECTEMKWNYYVVNGMYYRECDREQMLKAMNEVISDGGNPSVFKFAGETVYAQAKEALFDDLIDRAAANLAKWYGLDRVRYSYLDEEKLNKITIYWQYE